MKTVILLLAFVVVLGIESSTTFGQKWSKFSPELLEAAQKGDGNAQNYLGIAYSEGLGVKPNQKTAVYWFEKSADNGDVYGVCNLGLHSAWGKGIRKNKIEALKWAFVANSLDGLKCHPSDFVEMFKINECDTELSWSLAVTWLSAHPQLYNRNFGTKTRPWMDDKGEYAITRRENGAVIDTPVKPSGKCKPNIISNPKK